MAMGNNIAKIRDSKGLTQPELAKLIGASKSHIGKLERGQRRLTNIWIERIAKALNVPQSAIIEEQATCDLVGYVERGAEIIFFEDQAGGGGFDQVERPAEASDRTVAVEVRGDSMASFADEGSLLYYDDRHGAPTDDMIGRPCIVWTEDGRALVTKPFRGSAPGEWDLASTNGHVERNVRLKYAAKIRWKKFP